jgi:hypothetical protein
MGIIHKEESYQIIGICTEVHNNLGAVFQKLYIKMLWN